MKRTGHYELLYVRFCWAFIFIGTTYSVAAYLLGIGYESGLSRLLTHIALFLLMGVLNYVKLGLVKNGMFMKKAVHVPSRLIELLFAFFIVYLDIGQLGYLMAIFPIMLTSLSRGEKLALGLIGYSFGLHMLLIGVKSSFYIAGGNGLAAPSDVFFIAVYYMFLGLFVLLCSVIYKENIKAEAENKRLLEELGEKYDQLAIAQEEIKYQYEKLKETNLKLEEVNKELTGKIGEFYTLQQISKAIGSIFDSKELLKYVNDIILGVMGVNNSTIVLYDDKKKKLKTHTTNITHPAENAILNDHINCDVLMDVLNSGKPIINNFVDPDEYIFTKGRDVCSLICIPLSSKTRKYGLVLIEHKYYNAFDEENVRLLDIIGQQVGIAIENAELYQQMQEFATIDGLTGVYNRLYFQEKFESEFDRAVHEGYELSLAIFDIDHFKKFNDTFGHLFGDRVIKSIAELVRASLRSTDILARYGGEEFIILFPHTSLEEAYEKVECLRQNIAQTFIKDELITASVTVSFGVSSYPECTALPKELLSSADYALYDAKASGRNCVRIADKNLTTAAVMTE